MGAGPEKIAYRMALPLSWVRFLLMEMYREKSLAEIKDAYDQHLAQLPPSRKTVVHLPSLMNVDME